MKITAVIIMAVITQISKGTFIEGVVMAKFYPRASTLLGAPLYLVVTFSEFSDMSWMSTNK